jgi:hypothetical protein
MTSKLSHIQVRNFSPNFFHTHPNPLHISIVFFSDFLGQTRNPAEELLRAKRRRQEEISIYLSTEMEIELKYHVSKSIPIKSLTFCVS